jgi:formylglycine-generating enzyme required for sulfatase activity
MTRRLRGLFVATAWLMMVAIGVADDADNRRELLKTFVKELVEIIPGERGFPKSFRQGSNAQSSEQPVHEVMIGHRYWIAAYETPQNLYQSITGSNPSRWKGARNSAESMTWPEANDFCRALTEKLHDEKLIERAEVIRLPTESEWEYACRAGTTTAYSFGDEARGKSDQGAKATVLDGYGWHHGNAAGNDPAVGILKPNAWGLYDVHGYLWEFCADDWHPSYEGAPIDGTSWRDAAGEPKTHVIRSGSWKDEYPLLTSASRKKVDVMTRDDAIGFRCVKSRRVQ